jgi:hypothetical protein
MDRQVSIVTLQNENTINGTKTNYDIPFKSLKLITRKFLKKENGLILKVLELYLKMLSEVLRRKPKTVWVHNFELAGLIPILFFLKKIGIINEIIWDQHEYIDHSIKINNFTKANYRLIEMMSDVIISCNKERVDALREDGMIENEEKYIVLNNFPDKKFIDEEIKDLPPLLKKWLAETPYILAQGGANPDRYLENVIKAILTVKKNKLLIIGPYDEKQKKSLVDLYGENLSKWVKFWGSVPQMEMIKYIDHAAASIIFYKNKDLNHWLCAPNRLYQALGRGTPVIVGKNPPLENAVETFNCGLVIESDGRNVQRIEQGIIDFEKKYKKIKKGAQSCKNEYLWENQTGLLELNRVLIN